MITATDAEALILRGSLVSRSLMVKSNSVSAVSTRMASMRCAERRRKNTSPRSIRSSRVYLPGPTTPIFAPSANRMACVPGSTMRSRVKKPRTSSTMTWTAKSSAPRRHPLSLRSACVPHRWHAAVRAMPAFVNVAPVPLILDLAAALCWPHCGQNRAPRSISAPQCTHCCFEPNRLTMTLPDSYRLYVGKSVKACIKLTIR